MDTLAKIKSKLLHMFTMASDCSGLISLSYHYLLTLLVTIRHYMCPKEIGNL